MQIGRKRRLRSRFGLEEKRSVNRLNQGALSAFVGATNQGAGIIQLNRQVAMHPIVADRDGFNAHRSPQFWPEAT